MNLDVKLRHIWMELREKDIERVVKHFRDLFVVNMPLLINVDCVQFIIERGEVLLWLYQSRDMPTRFVMEKTTRTMRDMIYEHSK